MLANPIVTIAMPVYNPDADLSHAVQSIINQDFKNWELMIVDDGSINDIRKIIGDYLDPRIKIFNGEANLGLSYRLNECIERAKGIYFARMDADDIAYPFRLSKQVTFLQENHNIDLVATKALAIDGESRSIGVLPCALDHKALLGQPWRGICMPHPTWMGRLNWFKKNQYQVPPPYRSEDQELLLRASHDSQYATIDEILFAYRIKDNIEPGILSRTRLATLKFQSRYFIDREEYGNLCMSILAYTSKSIADIFLSRGGALGHLRYGQLSSLELGRWKMCYEYLCNKSS
jgi:glycosyltransferase involved in cell wall biosynthesis